MNKKILIKVVLSLFTISSFSQIEMGKIEKAIEKESKIAFPTYNNLENFINHSDYYEAKTKKILESGSGKNPFEEKECEEKEYYKRYNGLNIYYPSFSNDYKKNSIQFFKKTDKIEILNWSEIGNKYFTIISINPSIDESELYNEAKTYFSKSFYANILFELKNNSNNETIYAVASEYEPQFILVPYFDKKKELINGKTFIAISDFNAIKNPVSKTDFSLYIDKGTEWKAELTLLRKKDLKTEDIDETNDQETILAVFLSNEKNKVIFDLKNSRWNFEDVLLTKNDLDKLKSNNLNKNKTEEKVFVTKYGEKFGRLVYQKKLTIGMTKEMCSDICGITLNKKKVKNSSGEIEIWEYTGVLKMYFKNGKLSEFVNQ
ncbi:hypothetical protein LIS90_12295 [Flavobacterium psychrophilum]|uniref:hypothetical protein n=1 Tax=Flavobacterium psychrophilum TaxID=96345 RepID=UPI000B7C1BA1|nr:hypothetical protein [Flavobacterium psychrophilum]MCB6062556.1 hypothetical protein [Flavobacterium psychrophilum]MCB6232027.1 hypothetical protein [Flavobacterium psychrophilum]SNA88001.1 hypothetical protein FI146_730008 [Flavobacterium psychrophilum]